MPAPWTKPKTEREKLIALLVALGGWSPAQLAGLPIADLEALLNQDKLGGGPITRVSDGRISQLTRDQYGSARWIDVGAVPTAKAAADAVDGDTQLDWLEYARNGWESQRDYDLRLDAFTQKTGESDRDFAFRQREYDASLAESGQTRADRLNESALDRAERQANETQRQQETAQQRSDRLVLEEQSFYERQQSRQDTLNYQQRWPSGNGSSPPALTT
jgi:hypothetical protein